VSKQLHASAALIPGKRYKSDSSLGESHSFWMWWRRERERDKKVFRAEKWITIVQPYSQSLYWIIPRL